MIIKKNTKYITANDFKYFSEKENVLVNLKNHYTNLLITNEINNQEQPKNNEKTKTPKFAIKNNIKGKFFK